MTSWGKLTEADIFCHTTIKSIVVQEVRGVSVSAIEYQIKKSKIALK
ncbi:hypothetical protein H6G91_38800 [Nostoc muscorum FACHB-395]|nr:hypothetical protein [Desmonostoc muscorum FACHB-395]